MEPEHSSLGRHRCDAKFARALHDRKLYKKHNKIEETYLKDEQEEMKRKGEKRMDHHKKTIYMMNFRFNKCLLSQIVMLLNKCAILFGVFR